MTEEIKVSAFARLQIYFIHALFFSLASRSDKDLKGSMNFYILSFFNILIRKSR